MLRVSSILILLQVNNLLELVCPCHNNMPLKDLVLLISLNQRKEVLSIVTNPNLSFNMPRFTIHFSRVIMVCIPRIISRQLSNIYKPSNMTPCTILIATRSSICDRSWKNLTQMSTTHISKININNSQTQSKQMMFTLQISETNKLLKKNQTWKSMKLSVISLKWNENEWEFINA